LGSLLNGTLGSDALVEVIDFVGESFGLFFKSLEVAFKSVLLVVEGLDGLSVGFVELLPGGVEVLSQGVEELVNSFKGGFVELLFVGGHLGEGG
jgi:hypothetical protein